jgi:hypothetical protein
MSSEAPDIREEEEPQCGNCGSSVSWEDCGACDGGLVDAYEEDPLWYSPGEEKRCNSCGGHGGWNVCLSGPEWCEANPLPKRGTPTTARSGRET